MFNIQCFISVKHFNFTLNYESTLLVNPIFIMTTYMNRLWVPAAGSFVKALNVYFFKSIQTRHRHDTVVNEKRSATKATSLQLRYSIVPAVIHIITIAIQHLLRAAFIQ